MPSAQDLYNALLAADSKLDTVNNDLVALKASTDAVKASVDAVKASVDQVNATLINGFNQLVTLGTYTNQALYQNDQQNDTIICILEHISKNTCALLNEAVIQTRVQIEMEGDVDALENMYATANAAAALEQKRLHALKEKIEECCPPKKPEPPCNYGPCPAPRPIGPPPQVGPPQTK
jgi:hypothetical protein